MNILISCGVFHPHAGGAESLFRDLSRLWVQQGHRVVVVTRQIEGLPEEELLDGVSILRFDYGLPYESFGWSRQLVRFPGVLRRLWRVIRDAEIQAVCIGLLDTSAIYLLCLRALRRFRLVTYLHGGEIRELPNESASFQALLQTTLRKSDAVVAVSRSLAVEARVFFDDVADKTVVLANGVDIAAIERAPRLERARPYFAYVGRLARDKNVTDVIRAFATASADLPDIDLLLVGDGPKAPELRKLARDSGAGDRIVFLGRLPREEVFSIMKGALFLVLASPAEGHPIAVIEALVAGTPVIASDVAGTDETVVDGVNGALFEVGDVEAFAELMRCYASDPSARTRLAANAQSFDRAAVDIRRLANAHLEILRGP